MAQHGLVRAAAALAGEHPDAVCETFTRWRRLGQRELPWLAGPGLSALAELGVSLPPDEDTRTVERFLVGGDANPGAVSLAVEHDAATPEQVGTVPPDARAALVACVEKFFQRLVDAYRELHPVVRDGRRRTVDQLCAAWQDKLDEAAEQIEQRGEVVRGVRGPTVAPPQRRTRVRAERPGLTLLFVLVAFAIAALMLWAVTQGWPMEPVAFEL